LKAPCGADLDVRTSAHLHLPCGQMSTVWCTSFQGNEVRQTV